MNQKKTAANFFKQLSKQIGHADGRHLQLRASEYKYIFGMIRGAYECGAITHAKYNELYNWAWDCRVEGELKYNGNQDQPSLIEEDVDCTSSPDESED
jgi:hypothetical protein